MRDPCGIWSAIKHLEIHDGPGVRTTLFLKGCPLSCLWCHNPEGIGREAELAYYAHKCENCGACERICPQGAHTFVEGHHVFDREKCTVTHSEIVKALTNNSTSAQPPNKTEKLPSPKVSAKKPAARSP